jgi:hypothetical protein
MLSSSDWGYPIGRISTSRPGVGESKQSDAKWMVVQVSPLIAVFLETCRQTPIVDLGVTDDPQGPLFASDVDRHQRLQLDESGTITATLSDFLSYGCTFARRLARTTHVMSCCDPGPFYSG